MVGLVVAGAAQPAAAQMAGNPVYVPVGMGTGVNIAGDFGRGLNDASGKTTYFGGRATLSLPFLYVTAGAGMVKPSEDFVPGAESELALGGAVGLNVLNLPLLPVKVSAQVGAGYLSSGDAKQYDLPVSVAIALKLPTPGLSISPWVAPRLHVRRLDPGVGDANTDARFGASGGVNATFGMVGVHLAADYVRFESSDVSPWIFGAGLSLGLTLPGL
ncbi:MAG TPA: hypothetical protein VFH97_06685 [Gemmatimonadales bacterium]|nr:hypothetical protein [Gemmatimonadales bacterium]